MRVRRGPSTSPAASISVATCWPISSLRPIQLTRIATPSPPSTSPRPSRASCAASAAPDARRSKLPRISCATQPSGMSPAKVIDRLSRSTRQHGADEPVVGTPGIVDLQRKQQRGAGQRLDLVFAEIALVEVQCRPAVQLESTLPLADGDPPFRAEHVPAAGAAVTDPDRASVQSDRRDLPAAGRAIQSDDGFDELRPVSGKPAGNRNVPDMLRDAGDQFAAVDRQTVRQHEHAGEIVGRQRPADRFTVQPASSVGILYRLDRGPDRGRVEADSRWH